jgi:putative tricarboxylic transport membrane protein
VRAALTDQLRGRAELGLAALVFALGVFFLVETAKIQAPQTATVIGPRFFPTAVGVLLLVVGAWLTADVLRGGHGDPEAEEDIDVSKPTDWRTLGLVAGVFALHIALVERLGWPLAGAVLFFGVAYALGARRYLRDAAISLVLGFTVYFVFARLLGLTLPAGVLDGVI